ncbi:MAG: hypothetical protein LW806_05470 [Planctomycetaceae bacterium]|nr:hypothetical protein [Planctomycetaceae bacterium]
MIRRVVGTCVFASISSGSALAQDRLVLQQAPAEMRQGADANTNQTPDATSRSSPSEVDGNIPTVSLLLADGSWRVGRLESLGADGWKLAVRSSTGITSQSIPSGDAIAFVVRRSALRPALGSDAESRSCAEGSLLQVAPLSLGVIDTNDGQRLPGTFRIANGSAVWDHRWIGTVPLSLDRIASLRMIADRRAPGSADADTILLLNGDIVRGFIDSIDEELEVSPLEPVGGLTGDGEEQSSTRNGQGAEEPAPDQNPQGSSVREEARREDGDGDRGVQHRDISMERVAAFTLADMPVDPRSGIDVWTADGSIVGAEDLAFIAPIGWSFTLGTDWLRRIRTQPTSDNQAADPLAGVLDRDRFLPLAVCRARVENTSADLGYRYRSDRPARLRDSSRFLLGCTEIEIDGPSSISFEIPDRFRVAESVLTGLVSIAEPCPTDVRVEIVVSFGGTTSDRIVLDGTRRCQPFTLRSRGDAKSGVTISVGDGGNGVAGDRIVLERTALIAPR